MINCERLMSDTFEPYGCTRPGYDFVIFSILFSAVATHPATPQQILLTNESPWLDIPPPAPYRPG
jgi:hypothetical protein